MIDSINIRPDDPIAGLIDYPSETRNFELKPSIPWNNFDKQYELQRIVMSILGMSNLKTGGKIILGIKQNSDKTFSSEGVDPEHLKTYNQDNIYQIVRPFGDPAPIFEIKNLEYKGHNYLVFNVQQFMYSPVICSKSGSRSAKTDGKDALEPLIKGALYTRSYKPETKRVDNETEMREIIDLAIDSEIEHMSPRIKNLLKILKPTSGKVAKERSSMQFLSELKDIKK